MADNKPQIRCLANGPYLLKNDETSPVDLGLQQSTGERVEPVSGVALCRCGGSANKPYCDGTHSKIGFSDEKLADGSLDRRESYIGQGITIHDNRGICAHAGVCTDNLESVFRMGQEPWIDADGAAVEAIIDVIESCPSGALSYSLDKIEQRDSSPAARITVVRDGPYAVSGVELDGQAFGEGAAEHKYTLCRCGASKNKPFCDGSHWHVGFKDDAE